MCSPARASSTVRRRRSWRRCSTKAITCARSGRCIGSWPPISRSESGAISASIPSTPSPSWWPRRRTRPGPGTSPSCWGRPSGRTSTSTSCSTSSAATRSAGWSQTGRTRRWPVVLIEETCHKQGVQPQVLTLHSDRGAPMTSKCTAQLLADLGVTRSLSRPQVSDDNPFAARCDGRLHRAVLPGQVKGDGGGTSLPSAVRRPAHGRTLSSRRRGAGRRRQRRSAAAAGRERSASAAGRPAICMTDGGAAPDGPRRTEDRAVICAEGRPARTGAVGAERPVRRRQSCRGRDPLRHRGRTAGEGRFRLAQTRVGRDHGIGPARRIGNRRTARRQSPLSRGSPRSSAWTGHHPAGNCCRSRALSSPSERMARVIR